jgi:hypothetical protein
MGIECNKQCCENDNKNEANLDFNEENKIIDNNYNFTNDKLKTTNKMFNIKSNLRKKFKIYNINKESNDGNYNVDDNIIFIIFIQAIYRGYIYRKYFIEIKKNLIKYTEYKIECTKLRYSNKFLNNVTKNVFPLHFTYPFNSEDKETQTNSIENISNNNNYLIYNNNNNKNNNNEKNINNNNENNIIIPPNNLKENSKKSSKNQIPIKPKRISLENVTLFPKSNTKVIYNNKLKKENINNNELKKQLTKK